MELSPFLGQIRTPLYDEEFDFDPFLLIVPESDIHFHFLITNRLISRDITTLE